MTEIETAPSEAEVLALAAAFDRGEDIETPASKETPAADPAGDKPADKPADKPEAKAKDDTQKTDAAKQSDSAASKEGKDSATKPVADAAVKEKSKWAQNEERKATTWQTINAEKEALKAEKEAITREKAEFEKSKKAPADSTFRDEHGYTSKDYKKVAEDFRAKGDQAMAEAADKLAANLSQKEQQAQQDQAQQSFIESWKKNYEALCEKTPALRDKDSPIAKATVKILTEFPLLTRDVNGVGYAVRAAELQLRTQEFDGTKSELTKLKAEHEKLLKKLSIGGGSPTGAPAADKSFNEMSSTEQQKYLEQKVHQHDRDAGFD